jgi:molybdopterin-containing oxidoreductase family membrane subunit
MALMCVMVDLGNPQRVYHMLLTPNFRSIFVFDAAILSIYGILCTIDLWMLTSGRGGTPLAFALTVISLPAAIGIHTITAWILGLVKARETWHTALMAPIFLSSAIASGLALLIVMVLMIRRYTDMKFKDEMFYSLGKLMAVVIFIDLFFLLCELVTTFWPHAAMPGHTERIGILTSGPLAPLLFSEIFIFGIVPFILTAIPRTRKSIPILTLASIFVVIGIFLKRFVLLAMGVAFSPLGHLGFYLPTLPEISITAMIWATGFLIITLGVKLLPMEVPEEGH